MPVYSHGLGTIANTVSTKSGFWNLSLKSLFEASSKAGARYSNL
jgi:hypothetical protein